jgi:hypothetical protein
MSKINNKKELIEAIATLELKQQEDWKLIKLEVVNTIDSIMPINLLKNSIKNVELMATIKEKLLVGGVGILAGYVSKKVLFGDNSPIKKLMGALVQTGVALEVSQETEFVQYLLDKLKVVIHKIITKKANASEGE